MIDSKQTQRQRGEIQPLTPAQRRKRENSRKAILRAAIQIVFFLLAPALFTSAFTGVKQLFTAIGQGQPLAFTGFVQTLLALCLFTMVFGRFFCGFACPFGALGDLVYFLREKVRKKTKKKGPRLPGALVRVLNYFPFLLLFAIVLLCTLGVYASLTGWSPWDVFSMLTTLNLRLGGYILGTILLVLILVGMALEPRFFCRFLCPMGAVFRLLPILPWSVLKRDTDSCLKGCSACAKTCPVGHTLGVGENAGDCIRCDKCVGVCPKQNITCGAKTSFVGGVLITVGKAAVLVLIAFFLGATRIS